MYITLAVLLVAGTFNSGTGLGVELDDCTHTTNTFKCVKYISNYDGDTITVDIPSIHPFFGKDAKVRVAGIDTPEVKSDDSCEKQKARVARDLVEHELKHAKNIQLRTLGKDKYFRILSDVIYDGKNLSEVLLKNKLAIPYNGGHKNKQDWCSK